MTFEEWYKQNDMKLAAIPNFDPVTRDVKQRVVAEIAWNAAVLEMVKQEQKERKILTPPEGEVVDGRNRLFKAK